MPGMGAYGTTSGAFPATVALTTNAITQGVAYTIPYFNFSAYATSAGII